MTQQETSLKPTGGSELAHGPGSFCRSIEWYGEGQERVVEVDGIQVLVRFVGRKGRRARIAITAPPGAVFRSGGEGVVK